MADQLIRLDSYPFDSNVPTTYDERGYPVFDRGITSHVLAACWKQFFSDGIFASPETNLKITKGTGFNINIAKGVGIIEGHMGGVFNDDGMNITLTNEARGDKTYSIIFRYDNNNEYRSTYIYVKEGSEPAEPEIAPLIKEFRLGYVFIPSNVESIEEATITDERGFEVCPYSAPFMEVDIPSILENVREQAGIQYDEFIEFLNRNIEFIDSVLDESAIGYIQNQINEIYAQLGKVDLTNYVDNTTIEYTSDSEYDSPKLRLKDGAVTADKLAEGAITPESIDDGSITTDKIADGVITVDKEAWLPMFFSENNLPINPDTVSVKICGCYWNYNQQSFYTRPVYSYFTNLSNVNNYHYSSIFTDMAAFEAPNLEQIPNSWFFSTPLLSKVSIPKITDLSNYYFWYTPALKEFDFSKITSIPTSCFQSQHMSLYNVENITYVGDKGFSNVYILNECHWDSLSGNHGIYGNYFMSDAYFPNWDRDTLNNTYFGNVYFPKARSLMHLRAFSEIYAPMAISASNVALWGNNIVYDFPKLSQISTYGFLVFSTTSSYKNVTIRIGSQVDPAVPCTLSQAAFSLYNYSVGDIQQLSIYLEAPSVYSTYISIGNMNSVNFPAIMYRSEMASQTSTHVDVYFPSSQYDQYMGMSVWNILLSGARSLIFSLHSF